MEKKVIIDTDPGIDDAVALAMALFDPSLDVLAITAVAGNVHAEQATKNVQTILDQLDPPRLPRIGAATSPNPPLEKTTSHVFGNDGLGNSNFPVAELHNLHPSEKLLVEEVRAAPDEVTIIALGPLTNIARAIHRDPNWASQVGHLIIMGGTVSAPGNVTPAAEFNIYSDPVSAQEVFRSKMTKTLVPLDITDPLIFSYDFLDRLPSEDSRGGRFLRKILPFTYRAHRQVLGLEGIWLADAIAMVAATNPSLFRIMDDMSADVETNGFLTKGMTVFDRRVHRKWKANLAVAMEMDSDQVYETILKALARCGESTLDS
ncbi:Pyrimidine-specific ribonucleoside hydrolase [Planctomycetales bacterium 10988]|nr:Pyrimidine-specific ribonucleoside hydrolase [Planctomycetales bacterium 10988]